MKRLLLIVKATLAVAAIAACAAPLVWALIVFAQEPEPDTRIPSTVQLLDVPISKLRIAGSPTLIENPIAGDQTAIVEGRKLYRNLNCMGCHAPRGGGGMGPALSDEHWIYGGTPGDIYLSIAHGRPAGMPAWGEALQPGSIWALVTYVKSLGPSRISP